MLPAYQKPGFGELVLLLMVSLAPQQHLNTGLTCLEPKLVRYVASASVRTHLNALRCTEAVTKLPSDLIRCLGIGERASGVSDTS